MRKSPPLASPVAAFCLLALALGPASGQEPGGRDAFQDRALPVIERYCVDCHAKGEAEAGVVLDGFGDRAAAVEGGRTWLRVRDAVEGHIMPPADSPQPSPREREALVGWIEGDFLAARCGQQAAPPPVVIRRLNRQEYNNTIRDLLGDVFSWKR